MHVLATVKQHGFNVAKGAGSILPIHEASHAEEASEGWPESLRIAPGRTLLDCPTPAYAATPRARAAQSGWSAGPAVRCHVEVVGCAHAAPEVRRLVKGVSRGLLACQVQRPVFFWSGLLSASLFESATSSFFFKVEVVTAWCVLRHCNASLQEARQAHMPVPAWHVVHTWHIRWLVTGCELVVASV